jgi:glycerol uptake facilitator-like aquaporin
MLGIYVAGDSGGFLNPAITFCACLYRGLPWRRFPIYLLAQFLGGFVAAGVIYGNYITGIDNYEGVGVRTGRSSVITRFYRITLSLGLIPVSNASCPSMVSRKAL